MREELVRNNIAIAGPSITEKEISYVTDAVANAWYSDASRYHARFEKAFAEYVGVRHAVALPSCTSAIHLSLLALEVAAGDEVIVPDVTWIASAAPITYVGATPVFADIDARTWCLSVDSFEACISSKTRAVIAVDLYGGMPDMDEIRKVAEQHEISVIEDAAEAIGSEYKSKRAGSLGATGVFSFHGSKTLTTGEGGMLVTDDETIYERVLVLRDHGRAPGDQMFFNTEIGYKYKMSSMQAALGLAQLERIEELISRKRQIFSWYQQRLADVEGITLNFESPDTVNTYWMVTVIVDAAFGKDKDQLMHQMSRRGVSCRPFFHPLSSLPAYGHIVDTEVARKRNCTGYSISPYGLNLPSALNLTEDDVGYVVDTLLDVLRH